MRILVYPHDFNMGGSQINAIDLAAAVSEAGHEVYIYGAPGPLVEYVEQRGLKFIPAHTMRYRPAPTRIGQLASIARKLRLDLIHAYEWPPCLDAYCGAGILLGVPVLCTVLSMSVMPYVPAYVPLIMGTLELSEQAKQVQQGPVWTLEPPIDIERDHPSIDGIEFRQKLGIKDELLLVTVSRLAVDLKLDALVRAIDAVDQLAAKHNLRLVLVGGGEAREALQQRAHTVNQRWGREVVTLIGQVMDPRSAYAAADLIVGMGSSALRAMAIGKPVVVQGEDGFSKVFEPESFPTFLKQGFYGRGGQENLADQIDNLLMNAKRRQELGRFGRDTVVQRFSLKRAKEYQLEIYEEVVKQSPRVVMKDVARSLGRALWLEVMNHDPRRKQERRTLQQSLLSNASSGVWPAKHVAT